MAYVVSYKGLSQEEGDLKAIEDIRDYSPRVLGLLICELTNGRITDFQEINICFGLAGVTGYPVHAFGRVYCTKLYEEWK